MSAKKNKKSKAPQAQLSPKNYIKTKARQLPIHECLINRDWMETGMASIMVSRKMPSGNFIVGIYMVDIMCMGLKNTSYRFNFSDYEYEEFKATFDMQIGVEPVDYELAHNIIYDGAAYGEENGFRPDSDFSISQYILEEEDAVEPDEDLEFGRNGMPFYVAGPYDDVQKNLKILDANVGEGNYKFVTPGGDLVEGGFDYDDDDDDDEIDDYDVDLADYHFDVSIEDNRPGVIQIKIPEKDKETFGLQDIYLNLDQLHIAEFNDFVQGLSLPVAGSFMKESSENPEEGIASTKELIKEHPDLIFLQFHLGNLYEAVDREEDAIEAYKEVLNRKPGFLYAKIEAIHTMIEAGREEEAEEYIPKENPYDIYSYLPQQRDLYFSELFSFCRLMKTLSVHKTREDVYSFFTDLHSFAKHALDKIMDAVDIIQEQKKRSKKDDGYVDFEEMEN